VEDGPETCLWGAGAPGVPWRSHPSLVFVVWASGSVWATPAKFGATFGEGLYWVWSCSPCDWALICLVSGPSPLGLMSDVYIVVFLVFFRHIFYVILTCPPTNDESLKLVEFVSYKP
jgi:hypothetical protein